MRHLYRRTYRLRTLGMGLGVVPLSVVLLELDASWPAWAWCLASGFVWPHLAWLRARRSRDPLRAELNNLIVDSALAGSFAPLMHFNLLPSMMLMTAATADKISTGVRGLWWRSLLAMFAAVALAGSLTGFRTDIATSVPVLLACLPVMMIHTLVVSATTYQLIRKVQVQNQKLDEISRHDALTGLESRGHWQRQAEALLAGHLQDARPATLLLVDVDLFKTINDQHGHAVGDDILRGIADAIRDAIPAGSHAGRLGGDEFAVAVPLPLPETRHVAEGIRARVQALALGDAAVRCSVSIGMAEPPVASIDLRGWMEVADRALYRAKAGGRNRTQAATIETAPA